MSAFLEVLKQEHLMLLGSLHEIKNLDGARPEAREKFLSLRDTLTRHMNQENERLYTVLKDAADADPALASKVDGFAQEMNDISKMILRFLAEQSDRDAPPSFSYAQVYELLSDRLGREENILFPEYEKLYPA